ncbi:MAG TPA: hypothetical protein ENK73_05060 [Thiomicrospira sp.]|jgi:hypothetical protein|nr:hypothetical protein [Thiomicrospira sp.]
MHLIENKYETAALLKLPPNARHIAEHLLSITPLSELLIMVQDGTPDQNLLKEYNAPKSLWDDVLKATLLAKTTYFLPNEKFTKEEFLYLIKSACLSVDLPLNIYSIKEVIEMSQQEYPF